MNGQVIVEQTCIYCNGAGILHDLRFGELICQDCRGNGKVKVYKNIVSTAIHPEDYEQRFVKEI